MQQSIKAKSYRSVIIFTTGVDRKFNNDIPMSIPIAYALKGKSIHLETA